MSLLKWLAIIDNKIDVEITLYSDYLVLFLKQIVITSNEYLINTFELTFTSYFTLWILNKLIIDPV